MNRRVVTIFGASGFIGRHVVKRFAQAGWIVRAAMRDPVAGGFLKTMGEPGQVIPLRADITAPQTVADAVAGVDCVVNLVGILYEKGRRRFDTVHATGAGTVARAARAAGATAFVHMSALGADKNAPAAYARSKAKGEEAALSAFPGAVILRPSVVFGADDDFFNRFARLARLSPVLPVFTADGFKLVRTENGFALDLFGSGGPTFQPVYVGDVADAVYRAATTPGAAGKTFELGGPRRYSMKEVMETVLHSAGLDRLLLPLPFAIAKIQAAFLQYLPTPPLTPDQVLLMRADNVVRGGKPGLAALGVVPTACEAIVPTYLGRYAPAS